MASSPYHGNIAADDFVASIILYLYSKGIVDTEYLSYKTDVRKVSEVLLPVLIAASLTSVVAGLVLALFLPQKIAGPIFRIEQDLLEIGKGDLTIYCSCI